MSKSTPELRYMHSVTKKVFTKVEDFNAHAKAYNDAQAKLKSVPTVAQKKADFRQKMADIVREGGVLSLPELRILVKESYSLFSCPGRLVNFNLSLSEGKLRLECDCKAGSRITEELAQCLRLVGLGKVELSPMGYNSGEYATRATATVSLGLGAIFYKDLNAARAASAEAHKKGVVKQNEFNQTSNRAQLDAVMKVAHTELEAARAKYQAACEAVREHDREARELVDIEKRLGLDFFLKNKESALPKNLFEIVFGL